MRWLVTGAGGQLGADLLRVLADADVLGATRAELDITDAAAVAAAVAGRDVVVNAAAYTDVDGAEADEAGAAAVNADGPAVLAAACAAAGARLLHVSTDYVFAGDATTPYAEGAPVEPAGAYGRTKAAGERAVLASGAAAYVVRTAWVYGQTGRNFVKTMVRLEQERETIEVVDDQRGSPTWSRQLAAALVELAASGAPYGVYHCTNAGETTWCGLARAVFAELGADAARVRPTTTAAFPRPAPRPAYSVLSGQKWRAAGLTPLPGWREALATAFDTAGAALSGAYAAGSRKTSANR